MVVPVILCALAVLQGPPARLSLPLESARDATGDGLAFVEIVPETPGCYVGQRVGILLRFGLEEEFAKARMVQPFGTALDVPVQLVTSGLADPERPEPVAEAIRPSIAMDGRIARAKRGEDRVVDGRRFQTYEVRKEVCPASTGKLVIPAPVLALAYATRFEESFVGGRVPLDRVDALVAGKPIALEVKPLPEEGRPKDFSGAIGSFTVRAEVEPREVAPGEGVKLVLTVEGEGNLAEFETPRWREIGGFRVLGILEERTPAARKLVYSLAPVSPKVWQVPAVELAYFDPRPPAGYRVARTEPVDLVIRGGSVAPSPRPEAPTLPRQRPPPTAPSPRARATYLPWLGGVVALWIIVHRIVRRRR